MHRIFIDMDGVIVDFDRFCLDANMHPDEVKALHGAYQRMLPMPGAIVGVHALISMGFEVWLATKPPTGVPHAYADKVQWVLDNLPELKRRIIITHDKGLLGDRQDFLIDDRPHRANCRSFDGTLLHFGQHGIDWQSLVQMFRVIAKTLRGRGEFPMNNIVDRKNEQVVA